MMFSAFERMLMNLFFILKTPVIVLSMQRFFINPGVLQITLDVGITFTHRSLPPPAPDKAPR